MCCYRVIDLYLFIIKIKFSYGFGLGLKIGIKILVLVIWLVVFILFKIVFFCEFICCIRGCKVLVNFNGLGIEGVLGIFKGKLFLVDFFFFVLFLILG